MARLSKDQLNKHRTAFEEWQSPKELLARADEVMDHMGGADFFNQPGLEFVREAWAAAKFGRERGVSALRLVPVQSKFPDFEMRIGERMEQWEFTEADVEHRERGREWRVGKPRDGNYIDQIEQAPRAIARACLGKLKKHYSGSKVGLLVLLNIPNFGARQAETEASFPESTAPAKDAFREICILWNDRHYPIWHDGTLAMPPLRE